MHQLLRAGLKLHDIDAICLSHFHPDHAGELASFIFSTRYPEPMTRDTPLALIGGEGLEEVYSGLNGAFGGVLKLPGGLLLLSELASEGESRELLGEFTLNWKTVSHRRESRAYRLTAPDGFTVVYSGDTDYCEALAEIARDADLFICESAFPDGHKKQGHLTPSLAGEIAEAAGAAHLVLTHFYPICDAYDIRAQCRTRYSGRLTLAEDLLELTQ
jgi:ribonuclease BN (tRNA processing enzyme)